MLESLGIERPIMQAPMGGGVSRSKLAATVSEAGGLGTIAVNGALNIARELTEAKSLTGKPIAVGVLLPFHRSSWLAAIEPADVVVTFWGRPKRLSDAFWMHQSGSVDEASAAAAAGADAVIVQGVEAGGHVRGTTPGIELFDRIRSALPTGFPLLLAGGIAERGDVQAALDAGAVGAVAGTRFLMSDESPAHDQYKQRLIAADSTVLTDLFGMGWPSAPHRVVGNDATERWLADGSGTPVINRTINRLSGVGSRYLPEAVLENLTRLQRAKLPLLSPVPPTDDGSPGLIDSGPLYAGVTVARISDVRPAAELVGDLTP